MKQIVYSSIILLFGGAMSFSAPPLRAIGYRKHFLATIATDQWNALDGIDSVNGMGKEDTSHNVVDSIKATTVKESEAQPKSTHKVTNDSKSKLEQFVLDIRSLYQDLELGGGSIRREMNGLSFTYVAPPSTANKSDDKNNQLDGSWRLQTPMTHESDADWKAIHFATTQERTKLSGTSNPPPLMIYLPGLDGFGISATTQFDDLSSTFELWRMTVDKGNTQLTFSDLMKSVVKFVDEATKSQESPRQVIIVGESFGGLLACAVAMSLKSSNKYNLNLKGLVLVNPATSFDETNWEQLVPLLTSLRYLEAQEEIVDDRGNFRFGDFVSRLPTPYSVSSQ
jgi:hypothetical protein